MVRHRRRHPHRADPQQVLSRRRPRCRPRRLPGQCRRHHPLPQIFRNETNRPPRSPHRPPPTQASYLSESQRMSRGNSDGAPFKPSVGLSGLRSFISHGRPYVHHIRDDLSPQITCGSQTRRDERLPNFVRSALRSVSSAANPESTALS
jgi:hypothetical protein